MLFFSSYFPFQRSYFPNIPLHFVPLFICLLRALLNILFSVYEEEDELKSCVSGTVAGAFFKSTAGPKAAARGGAIGLGVATLWAFGLKKNERVANYI